MINALRKLAISVLSVFALLGAPASQAAPIQLGFIIDESGSIGLANFNIIKAGLASAIGTHIPTDGSYSISVVKFSSGATIVLQNVLIDSVAARNAVVAAINAMAYLGGTTNFAAAFSAMLTALQSGNTTIDVAYVNFATDGVQNVGGTGVAERNALIAAGVDNISVEGIGGGVDAADLQNNFCFPGPCTIAPVFNFPAQGFYLGVANAQAYADAIGGKIQIITQVPEPGSLALLAMAGFAALVVRRRRVA